MATVETGEVKNTFSMETGLMKNNSVSLIEIDASNVCQQNRSWIGLSFITEINQK